MITRKNMLLRIVSVFAFVLFYVNAQAKSAAELAQETKDRTLYGEIAVGALFVVALTLFIVWKTKHDRKERERHLEQMKKVQANKRRAA